MKRYGLALLITGVAVLMTTISNTNNAFAGKATKLRNDLTGAWLVGVHFDVDANNVNSEVAGRFARMAQALAHTSPQAPTTTAEQTPATLPPFDAVETFNADGCFAENSLADYFAPPTTPGRGLWARTGEGQFLLTIYGVLTGGFDNPEFQGTYRETSMITTNGSGDQFTATAHVEIYDPSGNFVFAFDGTVQARRAILVPTP